MRSASPSLTRTKSRLRYRPSYREPTDEHETCVVVAGRPYAGAAAFVHPGSPARHWQYKMCTLGDPHAPCDLNALGAQGWELVAATPFTWNDGTSSAQVFLKREI